jgi:hypothetical protein
MAFVAAVVFSFSQAESQLFFPSHVFGFLHFQQMQPRVRWEWRLPFMCGRKVQVMWEAPLAAVVGRQRGGGEPLSNTLYHILRGAQICSYHKSPVAGVNRRCLHAPRFPATPLPLPVKITPKVSTSDPQTPILIPIFIVDLSHFWPS